MNEELKQFCTTLPTARRVAIWFAVIVVCILLFPVTVRTGGSLTCLHCRSEKIVSTTLGWHRERIVETDFTAWYKENRPAHEHRWIGCGGSAYNVFSIPLTLCGDRGLHPLTRLDPRTELEFVQAAWPEDVEIFFAGIQSPNYSDQLDAVRTARDPEGERQRREYRPRKKATK